MGTWNKWMLALTEQKKNRKVATVSIKRIGKSFKKAVIWPTRESDGGGVNVCSVRRHRNFQKSHRRSSWPSYSQWYPRIPIQEQLDSTQRIKLRPYIKNTAMMRSYCTLLLPVFGSDFIYIRWRAVNTRTNSCCLLFFALKRIGITVLIMRLIAQHRRPWRELERKRKGCSRQWR